VSKKFQKNSKNFLRDLRSPDWRAFMTNTYPSIFTFVNVFNNYLRSKFFT